MTPRVELHRPSPRSGWWGLVAHQLDDHRSWALLMELGGQTLAGSDRLAARVRRGAQDLERALAEFAIPAFVYAYVPGTDPLLLDALWRLGEEITSQVPCMLFPDDVPELLRFLEALDVLTAGEVEAVGVLRDWLALRDKETA